MKRNPIAVFLLVALLVMAGVISAQEGGNNGHGGMAMPAGLPTIGPEVTLRFAATVGNVPASCGMIYDGVGSAGATLSFSDLRFYVSNVRLINAAGETVPVELTQDGLWQYANVALLDFEDGTSLCNSVGNAELNAKVVGNVPAGEYSGLVFDLGLPFELNHLDTTTAPAPLNVPALWWNWQYGYKYVRIDLQTTNVESPAWFVHLGSTGCVSPDGNTAPTEPCSNPNLTTIQLDHFDPLRNVVVADVANLLAGVNLNENVPMPPGCMSGPEDTDCTGLFPSFGLDLASGSVVSDVPQTFFRVAGANPGMAMGHGDHAMPDFTGMTDTQIIEHMLKAFFETPDNPLVIEPIVFVGDYAVSGWEQGGKGGRAFWHRVDGLWTAIICSGPSLKEVETFVSLGVPADEASALAAAVAEAEAQLPAEKVALFDSFEGTVDLAGLGLAGHSS